MIDNFVAVGSIVAALVSAVAAYRGRNRDLPLKSETVEILLKHTDDLKEKSVSFSRDNFISPNEIESLEETVNLIKGDLVRLKENESRVSESPTSALS